MPTVVSGDLMEGVTVMNWTRFMKGQFDLGLPRGQTCPYKKPLSSLKPDQTIAGSRRHCCCSDSAFLLQGVRSNIGRKRKSDVDESNEDCNVLGDGKDRTGENRQRQKPWLGFRNVVSARGGGESQRVDGSSSGLTCLSAA